MNQIPHVTGRQGGARPAALKQSKPGTDLGKITIREIALFIAVVAIGQRILPRPLDLLAVTSLPALYFPARIDPRLARPIGLAVLAAILLSSFLPVWHSNEPADLFLGKITAIALTPLLARIATWRCRSTTWDFVDPLVLLSAPFAFTLMVCVISRLFDLGVISWHGPAMTLSRMF